MPLDSIVVRRARSDEVAQVSSVLLEAAERFRVRGQPIWAPSALMPDAILGDVDEGLYVLALKDGGCEGVAKLTPQDGSVWPDATGSHALYVHRLAVADRSVGTGVSRAILTWCAEQARSSGRSHLRLDADVTRCSLRHMYEALGFAQHSLWQVDGYHVARYEVGVGDAEIGGPANFLCATRTRVYLTLRIASAPDLRFPFRVLPFACLVWDYGSCFTPEDKALACKQLLAAGCRYAAFAGHDSDSWHDVMDTEFVEQHLSDSEEVLDASHIMTTSHHGEGPDDVAFFFVHCATVPDQSLSQYVVLHLNSNSGNAEGELDALVRDRALQSAV